VDALARSEYCHAPKVAAVETGFVGMPPLVRFGSMGLCQKLFDKDINKHAPKNYIPVSWFWA